METLLSIGKIFMYIWLGFITPAIFYWLGAKQVKCLFFNEFGINNEKEFNELVLVWNVWKESLEEAIKQTK